jgi:two-component system, chemotaxis family, protein-glutamate methylesterase/glutaminase
MAEPAKVLIVDDSAVVRSIVRRAVTSSKEFLVVDTASNGQIALEKIRALSPDVVTLDVEMPVMDGLTALRQIRKEFPRLPVIMVSTLTSHGASTTVDALLAGADSYIQKPTASSADESVERVAEDLLPKLRVLLRMASPAAATPARHVVAPRPAVAALPTILAIGSSTGGPVALLEVLRSLPERFPLPVVITQHMPPVFTRMLASRLSAETPFEVREGEPGALLEPGYAWIAPGDHHMVVTRAIDGRGVVKLHQEPPEHSCRPAVDVMIRSVARAYRSGTLAVVLTGMGQDGADGCCAVRAEGGTVFVQDEASSVVWGMPGAVVKAGAANDIIPLSSMARSIAEHCRQAGSGSGRGVQGRGI